MSVFRRIKKDEAGGSTRVPGRPPQDYIGKLPKVRVNVTVWVGQVGQVGQVGHVGRVGNVGQVGHGCVCVGYVPNCKACCGAAAAPAPAPTAVLSGMLCVPTVVNV
ncbi:MAG TPA: hypothetical protein VK776_22565 [Bryobacteraceae bacterium]|nr:hypothetical protein [Bryobacteraceae bacterium]